MTQEQHSLDEAAAAIAAAESFVAVGHIRPDGDALGSALALALAGRAAGKEAYISFGEPFAVPHQFRYLDVSPYLPVDQVPRPVDLLVVCDTSIESRLGSAAKLSDQADRILIVDHHISSGEFGDVRYIDSTAAATAEMAYRIIRKLDWRLTSDIADALYVGLVTDTGRFQYSVTTPAVHMIAAELLEAGVQPEIAGRYIYEESPFGYLTVAAAVLDRATLVEEKALIWSVLLEDDLVKGGVGIEDTDGLIDLIRIAQESEVACLLKSIDGVTKGSLRSRGAVNVAAIAASFGGGGHHNASGFTFEGPPAAAIDRIISLL